MPPYAPSDGGGPVSLALVYVGAYLVLVLLAVCLATGLLYMAELAEEYSRLTRRIITYAIRAVLLLHGVLLVADRQPLSCVLAGAAAHVAYTRLLPRFPYIELASVDFGVALAALLLSNVLWLRHFYFDTYASAEYVAGFMVITAWAVPFAFFVSVSSGEGMLPLGMPPPNVPHFAAAAMARDAAAVSRARGVGGVPGGTASDGEGGKRSRNLVVRAVGSALRWVRGGKATGLSGEHLRPGRAA